MGATLRLPEHEEASLLCNAAATSDAGLLASLLAAGALPSACDYYGRTALHIAACAGSPVPTCSPPPSLRLNTTASNGYPLTFTGQASRNGQLENGPCILLDGVNQYGVITNTDDYSGEDWVLKFRFVVDSLVGIETVFSQDDGGGTGCAGSV